MQLPVVICNVKENGVLFNLFWYKVFVHWVTQFADGFRLNIVLFLHILVELLVLVKFFSPTVTTLAFFLGSSPQYSERKPAAYTTGLPTQDSFVPSLQLRGAKWTKMGSKVWKFSVSIAGKLQPKALGRAELRLSSTKPSLPILTLYTKVTLAEICIWKICKYSL